MARRSKQSISATQEGLQLANLALKKVCSGKKTILADFAEVSRSRVQDFFAGKPIGIETFQAICKVLEIEDWQNAAGLTKAVNSQPEKKTQEPDLGIDALVQEVRERIQAYIQQRCGTMRVLDMSQPIGLGDIYTNVNLLEKLTRTRGLEVAELIRNTDPEKFDRFCLGDVRERRVPGLKAVEQFSKLMILGKPGAGKTTFLKHLAIQCIGGKFLGDRVPVFITLKDFAETTGQPDLLEYIDRSIGTNPVGAWHAMPLPMILGAGRALILLDGLDEVRDADSSRVLRQIREFSQQFPRNQFVITCRIAVREYTFEQFTEVEIADFDDKQIADFSGKWFRSKNDPIKAERFLERLKEDEPIRELATNPLLLTLLCLVFEDSGSFPTNRARLYEQGVEKLLRKWNPHERERDPIYKKLSPDYREELLSQIAWKTLKRGNYFFKQREVGKQVREYIQSLPGIPPEDLLRLDSKAVLESIETQHGLLVERAQGIYSFSHLAFHEYFTARNIVTRCNPYATDDPTLQGLVSHLTKKRWREVFLLTVGMLNSADTVLQLMKARIDELLAEDERLQQFLRWVDEKAKSVNPIYKQAYTRAIYFRLAKDCNSNHQPYEPTSFSQQHGDSLPFSLTFDPAINGIYFERYTNYALAVSGIGTTAFDLELSIYFDNEFNQLNSIILQIKNEDKDTGLCFELDSYIKAEWQSLFQNLFDQLPLFTEEIYEKDALEDQPIKHNIVNLDLMNQWWQENGQAWTEQLRAVMIEYRNIGHNWQFSDAQKERLQQYYDANKLLVDCLNSDCYVSREVREKIEETLLLPIAEIQKRQQRG